MTQSPFRFLAPIFLSLTLLGACSSTSGGDEEDTTGAFDETTGGLPDLTPPPRVTGGNTTGTGNTIGGTGFNTVGGNTGAGPSDWISTPSTGGNSDQLKRPGNTTGGATGGR